MENMLPWIFLSQASTLTMRKLKPALKALGTINDIVTAKACTLKQVGLTDYQIHKIKQADTGVIDNTLKWLEQSEQHHLITYHDERYPDLLKQTAAPPSVLYALGDPGLLQQTQLAMVGTRNPSHIGRETAHHFAKALSQVGLVITSGLAVGVDAACHQGALDANGLTVAVMATGIDQIYPRRHRALAQAIQTSGVIVTEFPFGSRPEKRHFPQRNRLISGLSLGTLVVEAALKSGSLITARYALEQNREVFAIPGSIHNPLARGCHHLIRQGAKLVETTDDILDELGVLKHQIDQKNNDLLNSGLDFDQQVLVKCVDYEVTSTEMIIQRSGLSAAELNAKLTALELAGCIKAVTGGYVRYCN